MITKKLVFDHRGRTAEGKDGPIELRFIYDSKPYYVNTGIKVRSDQFEAERVVRHPDKKALNERLHEVVMRMEDAVNQCVRDGVKIDVAEIRRRAYNIEHGRERERTAMLDWLDSQVPLLNVGETTRGRYWLLVRRLREYGDMSAWDDVTTENIYRLDAWLHGLVKVQSNGDAQADKDAEAVGDAAVYNYHKCLKAILNRAVKFGIINANPYDRLRGVFARADKESVEYLTEQEIAAIESLQPMPGTQMAMARDLFVFQMYTGLSYSDAQAFDIDDYRLKDGKWVAVGQRIKTGVPYVSQLLPQAVAVLEKYGMHVPKVNNAQYNLSLKVIQQALGIRTKLHSHLARHTFATRMLAMGAKIENVSRMLGHTNIKQTQRYAKVLAESVYDDFDMVAEKMKRR